MNDLIEMGEFQKRRKVALLTSKREPRKHIQLQTLKLSQGGKEGDGKT
jgi:hypothetical protein